MLTQNNGWTKLLEYRCKDCLHVFDDEASVREHLRKEHGRNDV